MSIPPELRARLERTCEEVRAVAERENLKFVLVVEPKEERTGCFIMSDDDSDDPRIVRGMRELLIGGVERLTHTRYNVIKTQRELSPVEKRRISDGNTAFMLKVPGPTATKEELEAYIVTLAAGITALQSLDDLGEELNTTLMKQHDELLRRYTEAKEQVGKL